MRARRSSRLRTDSTAGGPFGPRLVVVLLAAFIGAAAVFGFLTPVKAAALTPLRGTEGWTEVVGGGFEDRNNEYAADAVEFQGQLYVATIAGPAGTTYSGSAKLGGELWRSADGISWTPVGEAGLGDPQNLTFRLIVFGGQLYAASTNSTTGVQVWRSTDGRQFAKVVGDGFGDKNNDSVGLLTVIGDRLVVGTANTESGPGLWSSVDGRVFTNVAGSQLGALPNTGVSSMLLDPATRTALSVEGRYYLGSADPTTGGEIYRSADGQKWERVADKGLGRADTFEFTPSVGFAGQVYVVGTSMRGFDVVRSPDGGKWQTVVENGFGVGSNRNISATLVAYGEALYLATQNNDPRVLIPTEPRERFPVQGFQLYRSTDGAGWTKIGDDGFGDSGNFAAALTVENGVLYLNTANYESGPQVFTSTDGREWNRVFSLEEPSPFNEMGGLVVFDKHVVQAVNDLSKGLSLWREDAEAVAATGDVTTTSAPTTTEPAATTSSAVPATATTGATGAGGSGGGDVDQGGSSGVGWVTITLGVVAALAVIGVAVLAAVLLLGRRRAPGSEGTDADAAFCAFCGNSLPPQAQFCPRCGREVRSEE